MALNELPHAIGTKPVPPKPEVASEMRKLTLKIAFDDEWTEETSRQITELFDAMAGEWTAGHDNRDRDLLLHDALDRGFDGQPVTGSTVLELGSGTGLGTRELAKRFADVVALDRSARMLENAPAEYGARVLADAAALPVRTDSIDVLVLVNMFLFPKEANRVLGAGGSIVWVNTFAENTPIHLTAEEVSHSLRGPLHGAGQSLRGPLHGAGQSLRGPLHGAGWQVTHSRAGTGSWAVARRQTPTR